MTTTLHATDDRAGAARRPRRRALRLLLGCAAAALLAACSPPPVPDVTYFRLPPPTPLARAAKPLSLLPIEIDTFSAEGVYAEQALLYAVAPNTGALRAYHYQLWSDPPTHALHQVYSDIFLVTAVLALVGVVPALLLWRRGKGVADEAPVYESYVAPLG